MEEKRYIYYLTQEDDNLESCSKLLVFPKAKCMKHLALMVDNATDTIIDMQDYIWREDLDEILYSSYDYCVKLSGLTKDSEPASTKYVPIDDYEEKIRNLEKEIDRIKDSSYKKYKQKKLEEIIIRDKQRFFSIMEIKAQAYTFMEAYRALSKQTEPKVIAISTRTIGWKTEKMMNFKDDLYCEFKTNFGYGRARYLYLIMNYKNVPIFLYSEWVKYFHANKTDIIKFTQSYLTKNSSWGYCFNLIRDIHNSLKEGNGSFVERWMNNEVRLLIEGLEDIANNKKSIFLVKNTNQEYIIDDKREFTRFKAEKLSGALDFIKSIRNLDKFDIKTQDYTDRIIEMNKAAYPELKEEMDILTHDYNETSKEVQTTILDKEKKERAIKFRFKNHISKIKYAYYRRNKERMDDFEAEIELKSINPDYKKALDEIYKIDKEIEQIKSHQEELDRKRKSMRCYINMIIKHIPSLKKNWQFNDISTIG